MAKVNSISNFNKIIEAAFKAADKLVKQRSKDYDKDSNHSLDPKGQAKWDEILHLL